MKILIYGPPGSGKSTLVKLLSWRGYPAIDLETLPTSRQRRAFAISPESDDMILGAADLPLGYMKGDPDVWRVLISPTTQLDYEARRARRDLYEPGKATQQPHSIEDWLAAQTDWDTVLTGASGLFGIGVNLKTVQLMYDVLKGRPFIGGKQAYISTARLHDRVMGSIAHLAHLIGEAKLTDDEVRLISRGRKE